MNQKFHITQEIIAREYDRLISSRDFYERDEGCRVIDLDSARDQCEIFLNVESFTDEQLSLSLDDFSYRYIAPIVHGVVPPAQLLTFGA